MPAPKGNGPTPRKGRPAKIHKFNALNSTQPTYFLGTDNPRQLRAITALLARPVPREHLDNIAGCSNGPDLIADLRSRGLDLPCVRIKFTDSDGKPCHPGVYSLSMSDRRKIYRWIGKRAKG